MDQYIQMLGKQKALLQEAKRHKGQKPPLHLRRSRWQLDVEFMSAAHSANARDKLPSRHMIRSTFIGEAYTPSTRPLADLSPIRLRDLVLETQHRGRVLVVRAFSEPNRMTSIQNAVEDEFGDVERLAIYNLHTQVDPNDVLARGTVVAVKEPYYKRTSDGGLFVRVDHPSDFVLLQPGHTRIPRALASKEAGNGAAMLALDRKEKGNQAYNDKFWSAANAEYTAALQILEASAAASTSDLAPADLDLQRILYRNRAAARLQLGRFEQTIADALAGMDSTSDTPGASTNLANAKAFFRAAKATYALERFEEAKTYLDRALALDPDSKQCAAEIDRAKKRLAEQQTGQYDFAAMAKAVSERSPRLDHASFLGNTKVGPAGDRGRGLFATKSIQPGEIVLVEKALVVTFVASGTGGGSDVSLLINTNSNRIMMGTHADRMYNLVDKLQWNRALANRYMDLHDGGEFGTSKDVQVVVDDEDGQGTGKVALDTFRVQRIAELNGFGCPRVKSTLRRGDQTPLAGIEHDRVRDTGIWLRASYANHDCLPNTTCGFVGDMMIVRALRPLRAGEEICMAYTNLHMDNLDQRQQGLQRSWGFACDCALCRAEKQVPAATMRQRARLMGQAAGFLQAHLLTAASFQSPTSVAAADRVEATRLHKAIRGTYPDSIYGRLPRPACLNMGLWVAKAAMIRSADGVLDMLLGTLREAGYVVDIRGDKVTISRDCALADTAVIHAAMYASEHLTAMCRPAAASALQALGQNVYITIYGTEDGFQEEYLV